MSIYAKHAAIIKELFVPKDQNNSFGKYNYRTCEDILKTVKPLLEKNNCTLFMKNEIVSVGERNYVQATVVLVDLESGETLETQAQAREEDTKKGMDGSQITGASSSYARKYALAGLFCIDNEKDSDATNHGDIDKTLKLTTSNDVEGAFNRERLKKYIISRKDPDACEEFICKRYSVDKVGNLNDEQVKDFIAQMVKKGEKI